MFLLSLPTWCEIEREVVYVSLVEHRVARRCAKSSFSAVMSTYPLSAVN